MSNLKVALIQQECSAHRDKNLEKTSRMVMKAADEGARLVILQELHTSLYFCQTEEAEHFSLAETIPGPTTEFLSKIAQEKKVVVVSSLFEKRAAGLYHNTSVVLDSNGAIAGMYRKMHIPDDPGFQEKYYFTPGDLGFKPVETSVGKIGVLICWDQWFPEAARLMAMAGAQLLVYPTAIGWEPGDTDEEKAKQLDAWVTIQRGHAIANGLPLIATNRVGRENQDGRENRSIDFWGNSFVCDSFGKIIARADATSEMILHADIDYEQTEKTRQSWPFFRDRRIDFYGNLLERFGKKN